MNDSYLEILIKRKDTPQTILLKGLLGVLSIVIIAIALMVQVFFPFAAIILWLGYILYSRLDVEYEYIFVNGELEIHKIMGKRKRKVLINLDVRKFDIVAPVTHPEFRTYEMQNVKKLDASSCDKTAKVYGIFTVHNNNKHKIYFEPSSALLNAIKAYIPRKVLD